MKVKATVSFAGDLTMALNEVRDVHKDVAVPLLACGYLVPADDKKAPEEKKDKAPEKDSRPADKKGEGT